jgi:hypothetical protein
MNLSSFTSHEQFKYLASNYRPPKKGKSAAAKMTKAGP